jgi:AraC-like DNA-binding protein
VIEKYQMLGFWCVHFYTYRARLRINGDWYEIHPGCVSILPPDADLEYHYRGPSEHAYAHFMMPPTTPAPPQRLPAMQSLGPRFGALDHAFRQAIAWQAGSPARSEVRLWDLLWQLSDAAIAADDVTATIHPAVEQAMQLIELRLAQPISIAALAEELDVSHNHLIRLFRVATGESIAQYIRRRRVERAEHLLRSSTLPIKVIARQVGLSDLHLFNKTVRRLLGQSPRATRGRGKGIV